MAQLESLRLNSALKIFILEDSPYSQIADEFFRI